MAEVGDITAPDETGWNTKGLSLTAEEDPVAVSPQTVGMPEKVAAEKAFAYAELTAGNSTAQAKNNREAEVRDTLERLGVDATVNDFEAETTNARQREFAGEITDSVTRSLFGPDRAVQELERAVSAGNVPVEDELLIQYGENADKDARLLLDEPNSVVDFNYKTWVDERQQAMDDMDMALAPIVAEMDASWGSGIVDIFGEAVPFALSQSAAQFAAEVEVREGGGTADAMLARIEGFILPGNARTKVRRWIMSIPPDERPEAARQLAQAIHDKSGVIFDNDIQTIDWIETVISSADEDRHGFDWDRTLYNLITFLDAIPFMRSLIRGTYRRAVNLFGRAGQLNRSKARDVLKEVLDDPSSTKGLVVDPEDLATGQLPKTTIDDIDANPSVVADDFRQTLPNAARVTAQADNTAINYTAGEVNALTQRLKTAYEGVRGAFININKFVVDVTQGDRAVVDAMYSRTRNEAGWKSPKSALNAALKITDGDLTGVRVMVRNTEGGLDPFLTGKELRDRFGKAKATPDGEEYFIQVRRTHFFSEADLMAFSGNPVFFTAGGTGRYLGDATQQFSREVWEAAYVALGRGQVFEKDALALAKPYWDLSFAGRRRVAEAIETGASQKKVFTPEELVNEFPNITVGEMKAYYAFRAANDATWAVANQRVFREMSAQGYRTLRRTKDQQSWLVRPARASDGTPQRAYNPRTDRIEDVTPELIERWQKNGGGVEVLHGNDSVIRGTEDTVFVIREGGTSTELDRLPINVLKYEPGYVTRIHRDNFFVVREDSVSRNGLSGQIRESTVHTARTQKEADEIAARLTEETGIQHRAASPTADQNYSKVVNDVMLVEQNRLVFGRRTEDPLTRADGTASPLEDPVTALHRAVTAVGRSIGIEEYVKTQEVKWINTYSDLIQPDTWRLYQRNRLGWKAVDEELANSANPRAAEARQLWSYYQMLRNTESPVSQRLWRQFITGVANGVERGFNSPTWGQHVARAADFDPFGFAKGMVFATLIAGNPVRQYALQSAQFSFLAGADPIVAVRSARELNLLKSGLALIDTPNWAEFKTTMARRTPYSEDEIETIVRQFKASGLVAEIDSYGYIGSNLLEANRNTAGGAIENTLRTAGNTVKAVPRTFKQLGFESGEINNLSLTYAFSLRKYLNDSGKSIAELTPREWQQVGSQASAYALGMHKAGTMAYQQGFVSLFTQFWSIQHKALGAMLPAQVGGSRAFTGKQKAGIAATQIGLYGAAGWGVEEIVRDIMVETQVMEGVDDETAQAVTRAVSTGLMELTLNNILTSLTDEPVDSSFGSSFAPAGAPVTTVTDFMMALIDQSLLDAFMQETAAGSTFGKYRDMARYWNVTLSMGDPLPDTPDKMERLIADLGRVLSGTNQAMQGFYALRTGQLMTQFGDHRVAVTWPEALVKGTLGVSTNAEEEYRRLQNLDGKSFAWDQTKAEEVASIIWRAQVRNLLAFEERGDFNLNRAAAIVEGERALLQMLDDKEREDVYNAYLKLANDRRGTAEDVFEIVYRFAQTGAATPETVYNEVRTNMLAERYPAQQEALLFLLQDMIEGRNERMDFIEETNSQFDDEFNFLLDVED